MAIEIIEREVGNILWESIDEESLGTFHTFPGLLKRLKEHQIDKEYFTKEELCQIKSFDKSDKKMIRAVYEKREDDLPKVFNILQKYGLESSLPIKVVEWEVEEVDQTVDRGGHDGRYYWEEKEWEGMVKVTTTRGTYILPFEYTYFAETENGGEGGNLSEGFEKLVKTKGGKDDKDLIKELETYFENIMDYKFRKEYLED